MNVLISVAATTAKTAASTHHVMLIFIEFQYFGAAPFNFFRKAQIWQVQTNGRNTAAAC